MSKRALVIFILALLLPLCGCKENRPDYVMYINGRGVTPEEYTSYCWRFLGEVDPENTLTSESFEQPLDTEGTTLEDIIKDGALEYLLTAAFYEDKAKELGIELDDADISGLNGQIAAIEASYGGKSLYERQLALSGMSAEANRRIYLSDILKGKISREMFAEGGPYEPEQGDLWDYFRWNYITATHILLLCVDTQTGEIYSEQRQAEALAAAHEAIERRNAGEDFFELLEELGEDAALKDGDLKSYTFTYGAMTLDFERAAWALEPGEISPEPVRTAYGYHVILRLELDSAYFEQNLELIAADYAHAESMAMLDIWKGQADIEYTTAFDGINIGAYFK